MSPDYDGTTERRAPSAIGSTDGIPTGTLVTVPAVPPAGPATSGPVVAVATVHWYSDPAFLSMVGGAALSLLPVIVDALQQKTFNWKFFVVSAISALGAYFRNRTNSVIK